jgi:hypothetical protein
MQQKHSATSRNIAETSRSSPLFTTIFAGEILQKRDRMHSHCMLILDVTRTSCFGGLPPGKTLS